MSLPKVYVGGTFDLFHAGHVELLRRAYDFGEVMVALNTDRYAASFKKEPVMSYREREACLRACKYVKGVLPVNGQERMLLEIYRPDYIVYAISGDEYDRDSYLERLGIDEFFLASKDIELLFLSYTEGVSSTDVVQRILQRHRGEPRQRGGAPEDAGQPHVPDEEAGRGCGPCQRDGAGCPCRAR